MMFRKGLSKKERLEIVEDIQDTQIGEIEQLQNDVEELKELFSTLLDTIMPLVKEIETRNLETSVMAFENALKDLFSDIGKKCDKGEPKKCKKCDCEEKPKKKTTKKGSK